MHIEPKSEKELFLESACKPIPVSKMLLSDGYPKYEKLLGLLNTYIKTRKWTTCTFIL